MVTRTVTDGVPNGGVSFWYTQIGLPTPLPPLPGDRDCDVCIVGGGLTGLWTAYYLAKADPGLRITVLEAEFAGYGASGRNGGWLSAELAGTADAYAEGPHGRAGVERLAAELRATVDEVIGVCDRHGIDADIVRNGVLYVARSPAQLARLAADAGDGGGRALTAAEARERINVTGVLGGWYDPDCARVQPAKLVRGLARVVGELGVTVYERTRVTEILPGRARTPHGTVRATHVLRCLEGYTAGLAGHRRSWLPMNSAIVVTEPLDADRWAAIGWANSELLGDNAHAYCYAQRTADGRIALGGRGVPYRFGSRTDVDGMTQRRTIASLRTTLARLFPAAADVPLAHAWCGVLGVPRDWCASVGLDPRTGLGWAGGYVGSGLTATNLAGRTLRDLVLGDATGLVDLPWTNRRVRAWEPEPVRWLGVRGLYALYRHADRREDRGLPRTSRFGRLATALAGR
ncbi:NAD(P)/FAD-dependent oxidoreductase [Virgisporangium aurantiacum]|uniref:FAD-dependent oxidoreductase n=1 Tax=Virgisporangium aurantiacum TaxID=175570 RepID=A0A8J3ZE78_9ACTN|nr:FAD-dependent oxidoreductase [Virgisporangium aurantiacum]GIJ61282.1 FAD-dependent oxidoreductase [Virgisporangium aurantiacum]